MLNRRLTRGRACGSRSSRKESSPLTYFLHRKPLELRGAIAGNYRVSQSALPRTAETEFRPMHLRPGSRSQFTFGRRGWCGGAPCSVMRMTRKSPRMRSAALAFSRFGADVRGVAAIELSIIAPTLALALICTADLGLGIYRNMQVQNAAQAGAEYAVAHGFVAESITTAVQAATALSGISASPAPSQFCGCPSATGVAVATCGATCPGGSTVGTYVTVSALATYRTLLPYPALPSSFALTAQSTVRIQ